MAFRLGEVFLWGFFVLLLYMVFRDRPRAKHSSRASLGESDDAVVATVVATENGVPQGERASASQPIQTASTAQPTGRRANVAGIGALFECVEYRCDDGFETHVYRIDCQGKRLSPSWVYREPFESVAGSFTTVAA